MSINQPQSFDQEQNSNIVDDDNLDNDDLVKFQNDSKTINFYYSQLTKYSKHIRDSYLFKDVNDRFPQDIQQFQKEYQLLPESVDCFFQLLHQNCIINKDIKLTYIKCIDLLKISKYLDIRKLSIKINEYISGQKMNVDFVVQMIQYELETQKVTEGHIYGINQEIEEVLTSKINECLTNDKFRELPIEIIHRIVRKSSPKTIDSNKLFDIIMKSFSKYCVLFPFLDLQKLSEDRLSDLCEIYSKSDENTHQYFNYLKCNLNLIREMNKQKYNLEEANVELKNKMDELESKISSLQKQFNDSENNNNQLQSQLKDSKELNNEQQNKMKELEIKVTSLQKQFIDSENQLKDSKELNNEQQNKMKELETKMSSLQKKFGDSENNNNQLQNQVSQLQDKLKSSEKEISDVRKQLDKFFLIKGKITAKVENGLFISAEINLKEKGLPLDTSKSKCIISTSGERSLGSDAYEKGELITSLNMKTASYLYKAGTYFVRCIVFNSNGESNEIVSNSVTTSGSIATFGYEGEKPRQISLHQGKYKLEVWGAKGGDSTGKGGSRGNQTVKGGLGGYSRGILNLKENKTIYVYVGGEGSPSGSSDGSSAKGGFPDGGGAKTGHGNSNYTTVPGTGGGSTSIRIGSDTAYARVIVAGGGGGAGGSRDLADPGGFGGGLTGGNCSYIATLKNQGAGTQTGSTCGLGEQDQNGDPGQFGLGATGKYCQGRDSGGGGGGGWYGGGSGGYGNTNYVSSGGGGSGWTFTESSFRTWQSGDSSNASKFELDSSYYLSDTMCVGGNEEFPRPDGNGTEYGHTGNGYAKITPL